MTTLGWAPGLPAHWDVVPLNLVAKMGTGHTPDRSKPEYWENCTIPWITLTDASRHGDSLTPITRTDQCINGLGLRNSAAVLHPAGTVVLSRTASVGHSLIMGESMTTTQDFAVWTCGPRLDPRYLLLLFRAMKPEWERLAFGSTHRTIYMPDLEALRIPLPPVSEQRRIVEVVNDVRRRADRLVGLQRQVLDLMNERRSRMLEDRLSGGPKQPLARAVDDRRPIVYGMVVPGPEVAGGVPYIKGGDVARGNLEVADLSRASAEIEATYKRARVRHGDLVLAIRGSGTIGAVTAIPQAVEGANLTQDSARISPARGVNPRWLECVLKTPSLKAQIEARTSGSSIKGINIWDVRRLMIPKRAILDQEKDLLAIESRLWTLDEFVVSAQRQIALLVERRRSFVTAAVSGQIDALTVRTVEA